VAYQIVGIINMEFTAKLLQQALHIPETKDGLPPYNDYYPNLSDGIENAFAAIQTALAKENAAGIRADGPAPLLIREIRALPISQSQLSSQE
jgi:hypothetical protein